MDLNYERAGSGEPLLLVHGIGGELGAWDPVIATLAERFDVIAVDLPGFGRSQPLPHGAVPTPAALARALGGLLAELGITRAHVAGNSLGGWVALELAVQGQARSVTGICTAGLWRAPVLRSGAQVRGRAHRLIRAFGPVVPLAMRSEEARRLALGLFVAHPERVPPAAAARMIRSYGRATAYDATATAMKQNHFADATRISVPVTLAFGERDRLVRPVRSQIPGARTIVLADCGHIAMWDAPELVARTIGETAGVALLAA